MTERQYFGTDGIRGAVGVSPVSPDFMLKLGWAAGRVFNRSGRSRIIIGKDTRLSGYMFESALESGLSAAGADSYILGPMPTPGIAYLTQTFQCDAGIVISASHNPHQDNGIKFFGPDGRKLSDAIELEIEAALDLPLVIDDAAKLGKAIRVDDAAGRYIEFCKSTAPGLSLRGWHIVLDCANGATYHIAPKVFTELGARVDSIGCQPDGLNINRGVGSTSPEALQTAVRESGADLGIAFDGDGDRVQMVDPEGRLIDGDELLFVIARHLEATGQLNGRGVVSTLMANLGLEVALEQFGIELARANVGDRYVMEEMRRRDWVLGGENSGHIICGHRTSTGDGIVAALQVLLALQELAQGMTAVLAELTKFPQTMINVPVADRNAVRDDPAILEATERAEATLNGRGRILLRPSGTEPVVRVMVEGEDPVQVRRVCSDLAETVGRLAGK